jgi:hypothetical protein
MDHPPITFLMGRPLNIYLNGCGKQEAAQPRSQGFSVRTRALGTRLEAALT